MSFVIGLDIGTTSTAGVLLRLPNEVIEIVSLPVDLESPYPGWAEQDPLQWWSNTCTICSALIKRSGLCPLEVIGIGVAGMLPAVVLLDDKGTVLRRSIQQSDARCGIEVDEMREEIDEVDFLARTGNGVNQQLAIGKLRWLEKHEPDVFAKIAVVFGSYNYINWLLTGQLAVDANWALESGFVEIARRRIADDLVALARIPRSSLPKIVESHEVLGRVTAAAARATGLPEGTPVTGGAADFIASALCAGLQQEGDVLLKFGGSIDVLTVSDRPVGHKSLYLDYHLIPGLYVPNGCMSTGGTGLNWLAHDILFSNHEAGRPSVHRQLDELADRVAVGAEGVTVLPHFLGEKTPLHAPNARGVVSGLSLSHGPDHLWRAFLEAYAYAIRQHIEVFNAAGHATKRFTVSDGGSSSAVWMQIVSDVIQQPLQTLTGHPGSCLGAAWTAAVVESGCSWSQSSSFVGLGRLIKPDPSKAGAYDVGYQLFLELYRKIQA